MKNKRPVNIDLLTIRLPLSAIASIMHRLSGLFLFFCIPFFLYFLDLSLTSEESFMELKTWFNSGGPVSLIIWLVVTGLIYHFVAGIKHLLMDAGLGEGKESSWWASVVVLLGTFILSGLTGVWLW